MNRDVPLKLLAPRVLVVEDQQRMREMLLRAIGEVGLPAEAARSAEQALRMLDTDAPPWTILVLDLNLPGADGLQCLQKARARRPYLQAVVLTGFGDLAAAQRAIRLDVIDFLTKPFVLDDLETALARAGKRLRGFATTEQNATTAELPLMGSHEWGDSDAPTTLADLEREHILAALARHSGNRAAAARELGFSERTLYYRLSQYQQRHSGVTGRMTGKALPRGY